MHPGSRHHRAAGFTYLWVLALLAVLSITLSVVGPLWTLSIERDREQALLHIGTLYATAIEHYYFASPGATKTFPTTLNQLTLDQRFTGTVRYLRVLYTDPTLPGQPLEVVTAPDGGIVGVFSKNSTQPHLQTLWTDGRHVIAPAQHYSDWKFLAKVNQ